MKHVLLSPRPWSAVLLALAACASHEPAVQVFTPPEPATTGNKWVDDGVERADGSKCFVLADEECGGTDQADYLQYFEAPIFRGGYVEGAVAYAVDGTNLWILDVSRPAEPQRLGMVTGVGRALAVTGAAGRLYVAAADKGVGIYAIDSTVPTRLTRVQQVFLGGAPALDLALAPNGSTLFVAAGTAGVVPITLSATGAVARTPYRVEGFASGISLAGTFLYVSACSGLEVLSAPTGQRVGFLDLRTQAGQAPRPAKDVAVAVDQNLAFVAAGRWGTLFVDISNPRAPRLLGNRTLADDLLYYVNGVTVSHGQVYSAAGDWGVDRSALAAVRTELARSTEPTRFPRWCSAAENPDRQPAPEFSTRLPPPRLQDPLDVVALGDSLYAFGDASRLGVRAIDVYRLAQDGAHALAGRYEEPLRVTSVAAASGRVAVAGKSSGLYAPAAAPGLLTRLSALPLGQRDARVVAFADDGRLISLNGEGTLRVQGASAEAARGLVPSLNVLGDRIFGAREEGAVVLLRLGPTQATTEGVLTTPLLRYGAAQAAVGGHLFVASGDWTQVNAYKLHASGAGSASRLEAALLSPADVANPANWRSGPPRRVLVPFGERLLEVVSFGARAGGYLHPVDAASGVAPVRFEVPAGPYLAGFAEGSRLWLVQGDRVHYRTTVVTVDFGDFAGTPSVQSRTLVGSAVAAARMDGRLYVADAEGGVRVFDTAAAGTPFVGDADLGVSP